MFGSLQIYPPPPKANIAYKCLYRVAQISSTNNTLDSIVFLWCFLFCLSKQWQRNHVMLLAEQNKSHMWIKRYPKIASWEFIIFRNHRNQEHCVTKWHDKTLETGFLGFVYMSFWIGKGFPASFQYDLSLQGGDVFTGKSGYSTDIWVDCNDWEYLKVPQ